MEIGFNSVNRMNPPQAAGIGGEAPVAKDMAAAKSVGDWTAREIGSSELAKVAGEERVDEASLRRDDDLGNLVSRAFDQSTAAAALPELWTTMTGGGQS